MCVQLNAPRPRHTHGSRAFRALLERDSGCCSVPGCGSTIGLEAHHVLYWIHGGKTVMANLVLLCRAHHHAVHGDGFHISADGPWAATTRWDGTRLDLDYSIAVLAPSLRSVETPAA